MHLIDTHTHLYSKQFAADQDSMIARSVAAGVEKMFLPNIDSESIEPMLELEKRHPEHCFAMMGLHPCHVFENFETELSICEKWLAERPFLAVGEIGIDLFWEKKFLAEQKIAFRRQLNWAKEMGLPVSIHTRSATDLCIEICREEQDGRLAGVFHCFGGSVEEAREIADLGLFLGIGGVVTYPKSGLAEVVRQIPLDWLVLETDAPYLPPTPHRGKRNESAYVRLVAEAVAEAKVLPIRQVAEATTANALKIFRPKVGSAVA